MVRTGRSSGTISPIQYGDAGNGGIGGVGRISGTQVRIVEGLEKEQTEKIIGFEHGAEKIDYTMLRFDGENTGIVCLRSVGKTMQTGLICGRNLYCKRMIEFLVSLARAAGCNCVESWPQSDDPTYGKLARRFLLSVGYVEFKPGFFRLEIQ